MLGNFDLKINQLFFYLQKPWKTNLFTIDLKPHYIFHMKCSFTLCFYFKISIIFADLMLN